MLDHMKGPISAERYCVMSDLSIRPESHHPSLLQAKGNTEVMR